MPVNGTFVELHLAPNFVSIEPTMSYTGHAGISLDAEVEAIRQCVFEIEQAQRIHEKKTMRHVVTIAVLSLVLFAAVVALISL